MTIQSDSEPRAASVDVRRRAPRRVRYAGVFLGEGMPQTAAWLVNLMVALGAGLLIYLIRTWGSYPDGTAFAVLLMNLMAPSLERLALQRQQVAR